MAQTPRATHFISKNAQVCTIAIQREEFFLKGLKIQDSKIQTRDSKKKLDTIVQKCQSTKFNIFMKFRQKLQIEL